MNRNLASIALVAALLIVFDLGDASARPEGPAALDSTGRMTYVYDGPNVGFGMESAQVELTVSELFIINDVDVLVSIEHTYDSDVTLRLESPDGEIVTLVSNEGFSDDNFIDTEFNDQAVASISGGNAPYTGSFRPIEPLSAYNGGSGTGIWTLHLEDVYPTIDDGILTRWELTLGDRIGGTVRGTVTSLATSLPLAGVSIELVDSPYSTITDTHGRYSLNAMVGTYDMRISYPGWCGVLLADLELADQDTMNVDASLEKPEFMLSASSMNLMVEAHGTGTGNLRIQNDGNCDLDWTSDVDEQWLSVHPSEGTIPEGENLIVEVQIDAADLSVGDYYTEITITHNAVGSPLVIPILLTVIGEHGTDSADLSAPSDFALIGSFPNPFNSSTSLRFALPQTSTVRLSLFTSDGRLAQQLSDQVFTAGVHDLKLDLHDMASGIYFAVLNAGSLTQTQKLVLIK